MKNKTNIKIKDALEKNNSKNKSEKQINVFECPVTKSMNMIGGKWKPIIIYLIMNKINRFGEMQKNIIGISKQMLTKQLRELEKDNLINRKVYAVVPPKVEYSLTLKGKKVLKIIKELEKFGREI